MILDKKLHGVLDKQRGILLIYPESVPDVGISMNCDVPFDSNADLLLMVEHVRVGDRYAGAGREGRRFVVCQGTSNCDTWSVDFANSCV